MLTRPSSICKIHDNVTHSLSNATVSTNAVEFKKRNQRVRRLRAQMPISVTNKWATNKPHGYSKTFFLSYFGNKPTFPSAHSPWSLWLRCTLIRYVCLHRKWVSLFTMRPCCPYAISLCSLKYASHGRAKQTWMGKCSFPRAHLWKQTCGWGCFFFSENSKHIVKNKI